MNTLQNIVIVKGVFVDWFCTLFCTCSSLLSLTTLGFVELFQALSVRMTKTRMGRFPYRNSPKRPSLTPTRILVRRRLSCWATETVSRTHSNTLPLSLMIQYSTKFKRLVWKELRSRFHHRKNSWLILTYTYLLNWTDQHRFPSSISMHATLDRNPS